MSLALCPQRIAKRQLKDERSHALQVTQCLAFHDLLDSLLYVGYSRADRALGCRQVARLCSVHAFSHIGAGLCRWCPLASGAGSPRLGHEAVPCEEEQPRGRTLTKQYAGEFAALHAKIDGREAMLKELMERDVAPTPAATAPRTLTGPYEKTTQVAICDDQTFNVEMLKRALIAN